MAKQSSELAAATSLDTKFKAWLERLRRKWRVPSVAEVAKSIDWGEALNRFDYYSRVAEQLRSREIDKHELNDSLKGCWSLGQQIDATRLSEFFADGHCTAAITRLVRAFPRRKKAAAARIDEFVRRAVAIAYHNRTGGNDFSGAALLASVLLTSLEPKRFVDYRKSRWTEIADVFGEDESYGEQLIRAGEFARAVCRTKTFRRFWPETRTKEPLWALSGICWSGAQPDKQRKQVPESDEVFTEGGGYEKLTQFYKRNRNLVIWAKEDAFRQDPSLHCAVCQFSFVETYGTIGDGFIEAHHHRKPVSRLKENHVSKVDDLAMVCANCHRILDREGMSIQELRRIVDANRKHFRKS